MGDQKSPKHSKLKKKRFQKRHKCPLFRFRTVTAVTSQNLFTAPMNEKKEICTKEPSVILPNRTEVNLSYLLAKSKLSGIVKGSEMGMQYGD